MDNHKKPNKQTKESAARNKQAFIKKYPDYGSVWPTLKSLGIKSRTTFYGWLKDEKFAEIYENELKPNRRDEMVSTVYQTGLGKNRVALCPVCEGSGKYKGEKCHGCKGCGWIYIPSDGTQLTAAFGFLKATDHISEDITKDRLIFCEKNQVELTGRDGAPLPLGETNVFNYNIGSEGIAEALKILVSAGAARLEDSNESSNQTDEVHSP
jgi:hypothetical protein